MSGAATQAEPQYLSRSSILWRVNVHFTVLSILAAILIGMGMHSSSLPMLVTIVSILALIITDHYEWIKINRTVSYFGMLGGAAIAIYNYWFDRQSNVYYGISNLHAVASMLVYIQFPLMFQAKDQRLYEHWGVFILLEFIVAALLNDNVLFGIVLIPSLVVGCSTLVVLAQYISHELANTTSPQGAGFFSSLWRLIRRNAAAPLAERRIEIASIESVDRIDNDGYSFGAWVGLTIGSGILLFAIVYFFGLPRLHTGAYEGLGYSKPMVGFSGTVSLEDVGELMVSDELALRMSMHESRTKSPFMPSEPPYIRGTVLSVYDGRGGWRMGNESQFYTDILLPNELRDDFNSTMNTHIVTIQEQTRLGNVQFSMPPFFRAKNTSRLKYNDAIWCLRDSSFEEGKFQTKQRYQFETSAFQLSRQAAYLVEAQDCLRNSDRVNASPSRINSSTQPIDVRQFPGLIALRDKILSESPSKSLMEQALTLEEYLASSSDFSFSLLPKVNRENGLDPIEDFAANHRTGHCQYFASTLTIMLRSLGLPARIVVGFRPAEYNDVGNYFVVRQRHAHAWVEVHLLPDEIQSSQLGIPPWAKRGIWLRLDPTPQAEGSNAGGSLRNASQSGQTLEAIEQLWKDGFMDLDSTRQPEAIGLFGASGDGLVGAILRSVERLALQLQSRTIAGTEFSSENWFSWRGGIVASIAAILGLFAHRFMSRIRWRAIGWTDVRESYDPNRYQHPSWLLFRRMMNALAKIGLKRQAHQTPLEFVESSQLWLRERGIVLPSNSSGLRSFIDAIYSIRYGAGRDLSPEECESYEATIRLIENFSKQKYR